MDFHSAELQKYRGYIFDLDGTLIDSMPYHIKAWIQVGKEHGFEITEKFIYDRGGASSKNIVLELKSLGNDVGDVDAFVKRKIELYRSHINEVPLFEKTLHFLKDARERGASIVVGTGTQRINAVDILKIHGIDHLIDHVVSSDDVEKHKPHPQTYLKCLELMGLKSADCLVIEDGKPGLKAAEAAHIDSLEVDRDTIIRFTKNS